MKMSKNKRVKRKQVTRKATRKQATSQVVGKTRDEYETMELFQGPPQDLELRR